jgi:hypothetical protein
MGFLFLGVMVSVYSLQYLFGGQFPFSQKVIYFSSPDSFSAFDKISYLHQLETAKRLEAMGNPQYSLIQNTLSFLPGTCSSNPGYLFILNSIIHTFCGLLIFVILRTNFTETGALVGMAVFVSNPTYLEWTANLLKDGIFIAGCLLFILCGLRILGINASFFTAPKPTVYLMAVTGIYFIYKSRYYFLDLICVFGLLIFFFALKDLFYLKPKNYEGKWRVPISNVLAFILVFLFTPFWLGFKGRDIQKQGGNYLPNLFQLKKITDETSGDFKKILPVLDNINWNFSNLVPDEIEYKMFSISVRRQGFLTAAGNSKTDENIKIQSAREFVAYMPQAILNGWLSPFPRSWFEQGSSEIHSLGRKVLGCLTLFYWPLLISGAFYFWKKRENNATLVLCGISLAGVLFFAYLVPNIGALNRMRYAFYMLWIAFGAAYLVEWITARFSARASFGKTAN